MRAIEWTARALDEIAAVDRPVAIRLKESVERLASTGVGNVRRLQGIRSPEYRLRVGDWRVRFNQSQDTIRILRVSHRREAYR